MSGRSERVELRQDVHLESLPSAIFTSRVLERGLNRVLSDGWATSAATLEALGPCELAVGGPGRELILFERDGVLVQVSLYSGQVHAAVGAADDAAAAAAFAWLRETLPAPDPSATHEVMVTFWTYGPHGPQPTWRSIAVPAWDEITDNYPEATRERLARIMQGFTPARGGQLVLWHGLAGTGKTFALRALAWEWRDWCEFHYIVDPDAFFGQHADYMMGVLMQPSYSELSGVLHTRIAQVSFGATGDILAEGYDGDDPEQQKPWRLLMLEDTGELLQADARAVMGQALSRFLNVVDGLIGQGLRVLVLVTTNEEIRKLHPAVARPGRAAANIEFTVLSAAEVRRWLDRNGLEGESETAATLASLYALKEGLDPREVPQTGFAP